MAVQCKTVALLAFVLVACAFVGVNADMTEDIRQIVNRRKGLEVIRDIVDDLHRQLTTLHKRSCHIDAGLNRGCDYKDILDAVEENKFWKSRDSPGRRRRSVDNTKTKSAPSSGRATTANMARVGQSTAN
ncbi:uncharacterized protein LOC8042751 isoform X2 [Ixodes scapularis]|uniref:uncharacterized protein LOC8042751 isoform X2 n=1 Tax=Ixodes scapularis TaxID=6945 RepID=UPI001A9FBA75|nr:uncharacterized protein LOC8042751 isoform X2 [Ixodes scapularis]